MIFRKLLLPVYLSLLALSGHSGGLEEKIAKKVESLNPDIPVAKVAPSPVNGILEVQLENNEFLYVTRDTQYIFSGPLFKTGDEEGSVADLTALRKKEARQETLQSIDLSQAVTFPGKGSSNQKVIVFTDATCPYCQKFHENIERINNEGITVHYLAYPRKGVNSQAAGMLDVVWCSPDSRQALTLAKQKEPERIPEEVGKRVKQCASPVAEHYQLGQKLGVTGTPGIYTLDGRHLGGYVSPDQLREAL